MESSSSDYYTKDDNEEESLLANVASLRHELKITEWSLHNLGEELSRQGNKIAYINCIYKCKMARFHYVMLKYAPGLR